jgi:hypothetical protein
MEVDTPVHTAPISGAIDAPGEAVGQGEGVQTTAGQGVKSCKR